MQALAALAVPGGVGFQLAVVSIIICRPIGLPTSPTTLDSSTCLRGFVGATQIRDAGSIRQATRRRDS
jgi:hypothetical protein